MLARLHRAEDLLIALLLGALVILAALQIVLRVVWQSGFPWLDPLLRTLVLWVGLLGALAAVRERKHISLDVMLRLAPLRLRGWMLRASGLFAALVCAVLAWVSLQMVLQEHAFGAELFQGLPAWIPQLILPFAFVLMALRFLLQALMTQPGRDSESTPA